jgi:hypothetical protein
VGDFFQPPPRQWPEQAPARNAPRWTGRPQGQPLGVVVEELLLARSREATIEVAYIDAFPEGFELKITATANVEYHDLARSGDSAPDVFGGHWPMAGESRDAIPAQLLRVGVQFADGRVATNISGHDRRVDGPVIWSLGGGGRGHRGVAESHFRQGYWVSPLPPPGPVAVVCEWPALEIPVSRQQLDAQLILDAADRARAMFPDGPSIRRDDREWQLGTDTDIAWIKDGTVAGRAITSAIPPTFAAYCTLELPGSNDRAELAQHEHAVIALLNEHTTEQRWWLGYLDTGASDVVFPYAPRTTLYSGWDYVLVQAGPQQAASWRDSGFNWTLPDLMFPGDRSWLLSTLWDDAWSCIGGPEQLVNSFLNHPTLGPRTRRVTLDQDATPPDHESH